MRSYAIIDRETEQMVDQIDLNESEVDKYGKNHPGIYLIDLISMEENLDILNVDFEDDLWE